MTTKYLSKREALKIGMFYAGRSDLYKDNDREKTLNEILKSDEVKIVEGNIKQFGFVHEDCTMLEFKNDMGKIVRIATTKLRDGFDCWLIDPERGVAVRT